MANPYRDLEKVIDDNNGGACPIPVFTVETWGGGNYYLQDNVTGKCIRLTPAVYWAIIEHLNELMKQSTINGG